MSEDAKTSMILCSGLEPAEQEKVERLDGPHLGEVPSHWVCCADLPRPNRR